MRESDLYGLATLAVAVVFMVIMANAFNPFAGVVTMTLGAILAIEVERAVREPDRGGAQAGGTYDDEWHQERAKQTLEQYRGESATLEYCELCNGLFASYDPFYDHRVASESDRARDRGEPDGFDHHQTLRHDDEIPEEATVGLMEPCVPSEVSEE